MYPGVLVDLGNVFVVHVLRSCVSSRLASWTGDGDEAHSFRDFISVPACHSLLFDRTITMDTMPWKMAIPQRLHERARPVK